MQQGTLAPSNRNRSVRKSKRALPVKSTNAHVLAADLERGLRGDIAQWVKRVSQRPEPKATLINIEKGRSASINKLCVGLAALATSDSSRDSIEQFVCQLYMRLLALAPIQPRCAISALEAELALQQPADLAQWRGRIALETGNIGDIDRLVETSFAHKLAIADVIEQATIRKQAWLAHASSSAPLHGASVS